MALTQISTAGVKDDAVTAGKIPANAVGSSELADNAVDTAAIADDAVTQAKIAAGAVSTTELSNSGVTTAKIADDNVTQAKIAAGAVSTTELSNSGVTTAKIADNAVTAGKLASGVQTTINNNADNRVITGSGTANTLEAESNVVIDSSGNVGIGMTTVGAALDVNGASGDALRLSNGSTAGQYRIGRNTADGKLEFYGTQSGDVAYTFGGVNGEKVRIQPAGGISFNGDTAAANALSDYEEGTFTCTLTGSSSNPSYGTSSNAGFYVRIGKFVSLYYLMIINSVSSQGSGNWQIEGIPFSHSNSVNAYRSNGIIGYNDIFATEVNKLYVTNSDKLLIIPNGVTQSNQTYAQNALSTGYFSFSITYITDS